MRTRTLIAAAAFAAAAAALLPGTASALAFRTVLTGFASPVYVASTPSEPGRLYVVEQPGRIRIVEQGRRAGTFLDISGRVRAGGEQGLLSVAFHPDYARNGRFYVDYTDTDGNTRVVEFRARGGRGVPSSARQLLFVRQPYANHNGGQLQFAPDGRLWVGMGDGGAGGDPQGNGQDLSSRLGKLLAIDVSSGRVSTIAYGLRNPWRFSFDRANGDLYLADVGQNEWEEVDYRARGARGLANYGWSVFEGRARFKDEPPNPRGELVAPVAVYSHAAGCSITGGYVYRGKRYPALRGRYLYGDYCSGAIWSLAIRGGRTAGIRRERPVIRNLTSFGEDAAGELYAVTGDGVLYRISA